MIHNISRFIAALAIRDLSNAVCVATCKFTNDQFAAAFDPDENPAPAKLARQMTSFGQAYQQLDTAYAIQQKSDDPQPDGGDKE